MLGLLTGIGYVSSIFLTGCEELGIELAVSAFMIFNTYCAGYYPLWEFILLPLPDFVQIAGQLMQFNACILNVDSTLADEVINGARLA